MGRKLVSFDWAIKRLLRSKANFGILEGFLSELLFTTITILEVLESESNKDADDGKFNRVDIKVKDTTGQIFIIEIQHSRELDYIQRVLFGTSKTIIEHLKEGAPYTDVVKVISVNILYFDFGKGDDYIYHGTTTFHGLHTNEVLQLSEAQKKLYHAEKIADVYPEYYLIDVKNFNDIAKDTLDEWIYFLKNEEIKDSFKARGLKEAKEALDIIKMSESERIAYERYQKELHHEASLYQSTWVAGEQSGLERGEKIGLQKGERIGLQKGERIGLQKGERIGLHKGERIGLQKGERIGFDKALTAMVQKMKKENIDNAVIANITGLSIEQISEL